MMRYLPIILLCLSGCAVPLPAYVASPLQPDNCGTPEQFKRCLIPHQFVFNGLPPRPAIIIDPLPPE
jgi:hypothetical protein